MLITTIIFAMVGTLTIGFIVGFVIGFFYYPFCKSNIKDFNS